MLAQLDFGYLWPWTHGHLVVAAVALSIFLVARWRRWPRGARIAAGLFLAWSLLAFFVVQYVLGMNRELPLPTAAFLTAGSGEVLDMGAGSGRSTLMVLKARPHVNVVALDSFSAQYVAHFGNAPSGQSVEETGIALLRSNLRAAGVGERATIKAGDMRALPFTPASFDGVVSTYAIDHLSRADRDKALFEAARVLKPGGEFLLMVLTKDFWLSFAYGPLFLHGGGPSQAKWAEALQRAGFQIIEQGQRPATFYFLARKQ